jgi:hypothetical protein
LSILHYYNTATQRRAAQQTGTRPPPEAHNTQLSNSNEINTDGKTNERWVGVVVDGATKTTLNAKEMGVKTGTNARSWIWA